MGDITIHVKSFSLNLAPDAFHRWALHYYKCKQDFEAPHSFSPVPYFLLCRAIELEIKSKHLTSLTQSEVKKKYGHNLIRAYNDLDAPRKTLDAKEESILKEASAIYNTKGFEYFDPKDALTAFSRYPDLTKLDAIARKLIEGKL